VRLAEKPALNPIETVFAILKTMFRKADTRPIKALWRKAENLLDTFTPDEGQIAGAGPSLHRGEI
jgi:hypothetical protein